ncbi:MAG: glycosyltransferase [Burkholderiales bacterium]|nr:glycosyltransferase [Burkholderiales bacterium]
MKILHVTPTYFPATRYGGPIVSVHGLCAGLASHGHDVHVYTTNVDGPGVSDVPLGKPVERNGVNVWYFATGIGRRLYRSPAMHEALLRTMCDFDIVHLHAMFLWPTLAGARTARRAGVPYVVSPRGMLVADLIQKRRFLLKTTWISLFDKATIVSAASVHVTTPGERDALLQMKLPARRIDIVPNGIDIGAIPAADPPREERSGGRIRLLSLGRLSWEKGLDRIIRALPIVHDVDLVIAGNDDSGHRAVLEELASKLQVAERIHFAGDVRGDAKWRLLRSADIFVMPSHSENFGIAALEAMACAIPVLVTPGVGLATAIEEAGAGLVAEGEPEALATALASLVRDPGRRLAMGRAGEVLARTQYDWSGIAAQMEAVYRACVMSGKTPNDLVHALA